MNSYQRGGWRIKHQPQNPVTGRYVATRFGVEINAHSLEALERMIDQRDLDNKARAIVEQPTPEALQLRREQRIADQIDGYDRDDLGESPDY